jgi:hypothetical protein
MTDEEKLKEKPEVEPIWDGEKNVIHPALDFIRDRNLAVVAQWIPCNVKNSENVKQREILTLIFSDRNMIYLTEDSLSESNIRLEVYPNKIRNRWSLDGIKHFQMMGRDDIQGAILDGKVYTINLKKTFEKIKEELKYYIDLIEEENYDFVTLWCIGTYFFPLFNAYPYLFINAIKRSGKTKLLRFLECLAFNAKNTLSLTSATLFRLVQNSRCTLLIDEVEKLPKKEIGDFRSMLLAGYKKGAKVPRSTEMRNRKAYIVEEYDVFSPKALANIEGIEDVLEDRTITIIMQRTLNQAVANREIDFEDIKWQNIRDELYINLFHAWQETLKNYTLLRELCSLSEVSEGSVDSEAKKETNIMLIDTKNQKNVYIVNHSETTLTTLDNKCIEDNKLKDSCHSSIKEVMNELKNIKARDFELWCPILSLALTIDDDLFARMVRFALKKCWEKYEENLTETTDVVMIETLLELVDKDNYYSVKAVKASLQEKYEEGEREWINTRWIGRALRRLGFIEKRRLGTGVEIRMTPESVKKSAQRLGIDVDKILAQKTEDKTEEEVDKEEQERLDEV